MGRLLNVFKLIDKRLEVNVTERNNTRHSINNKFFKQYNSAYFPGLKLFGNINIKADGIFNSKIYYVVEDLGDKVSVKDANGTVIEKPIAKKCFDLGFAATVYKYQGYCIVEEYNIWDLDKMDANSLYIALTRAKKLSQIHLQWTNTTFEFAKEKEYATFMELKKIDVGYIYFMTNDKHKVGYVGKTKTTVDHRFKEHQQDPKDSMHAYNGEWKVETICNVAFYKDIILDKTETHYIEQYYNESEYKLINKAKIPKQKSQVETKIKVGSYDENLKKMFKIEKGKNYFRIKVSNNNVKVNIKRTFSNEVKEKIAL
jgi:hypothetical protein